MNSLITNIGSNVTRIGSKLLFKVKKSSPELLIGGGVALIVVSTVLACKATKKAQEYTESAAEKMENLKEDHDNLLISDNEYKRERMKVQAELAGHLVGNYTIAAAVGMTGIAMIFTSHGIMKKRNGTLLAAYNALDAAFQKYRDRVRADEDGINKDQKYMFGDSYPRENDDGLDSDQITAINKEGITLANQNGPYGPYCFEFSKFTSNHWEPHAFSNLNTIRQAEEWGNGQLRFFGHLFLNDILKYVGLDPVPWGQLVGWIRGANNGDNKVRILATEDEDRLMMDTEGWKKPIFLDFNCDGVIWDKI